MAIMFLIRTAFWLSLVVLLLPTDARQQAKLYAAASDAATQAATFCDRNKGVCDKGSQYWAVFQTKLEFGTRMAMDLAAERVFGRSSKPEAVAAGHTLTPADMAPSWRAPVRTLARSGA